MKILPEPVAFQWDRGNIDKNSEKHKVTIQEAEEVFLNEPFVIADDAKHSNSEEQRFYGLGQTKTNRRLFVAFTIRNKHIRVISIRDIKKKGLYMSDLKKIPKFKNVDEEAKFWNEHDSADYIDWSKASKTVFPNLKASTESISLRLPSALLARIKELANEKDVPYQSLMKVYLSDQVKRELKTTHK